jgi:superfamily II DNA helicase RecQ
VAFLITKGQNITRKKYQVVIVSPEILNNDSRFEDLWGTKRFTDSLINLVLDEAHVVKEWGGTFRSDYLRIGPIRYLLTRKPTVGLHLGTATMPPHRVEELIANLHLRADHMLSTLCPYLTKIHLTILFNICLLELRYCASACQIGIQQDTK